MTEINNYYDDRPDRGSDANFQQFDPGAPGVQDANFDNLDDSTFDNSTVRPTTAAATTTSEDSVRLGSSARRVRLRLAVFVSEHDHLRADRDAIVKVDHVLVHHPDAA